MRKRNRTFGFVVESAKALTVGALCGVMVVPPGFAEGPHPGPDSGSAPKMSLPSEKPVGILNSQQRVLHALNRLTFGPRPGDEEAVLKMGLENWFQQQLHPDKIDDSAFEERLLDYPALKLSTTQLFLKFPSPNMLRQAVYRGGIATPSDPVERAIYADATASYEAQRRKQEREQGAPGSPQANAAGDMQDEAMQPAMNQQNMAQQDMKPAYKPGQQPKNAKEARAMKHQVPVEAIPDEEVSEVMQLPAEQRFERLLAMKPGESVAFRDALRPFQRVMLTQGMTPQQREAVEAMQSPARVVGSEELQVRLLRDVLSQRQLQAVMTDFWLNHFSVYLRKNQLEPYFLPAYENQVILPHALGNFESMLIADAMSPAMLMYLDNWESVGPNSLAASRFSRFQAQNPDAKVGKAARGINENYARELMELHTLGVNGGYTQKDVIEVAKCFTGWTIDRPYVGGPRRPVDFGKPDSPGEFVFDQSRHEPGKKIVLGHVIEEGGMKEGLEVLHILANSPATAHFVSTKLAIRFVSDTPPPALVDRMSATFLRTHGDIPSVLNTMFHSPEFWSPQVYRAKVKTPIEFMASALRASNAKLNNPLPLVQAMDRLGMPIFGMQTPNGYSWKADEWVSSNALISRMNFALILAGSRMPGTRTNVAALLGSGDTAATPVTEQQLEAVLLGQAAAPRTRETVLAQSNNPDAQKTAAQNFASQPTRSMSDDDDAMAGNVRLLRAKAGKNNNRGYNGGSFNQLATAPETPLDTMAGLLLGSPDFQRR